jgi:hypothetical protein
VAVGHWLVRLLIARVPVGVNVDPRRRESPVDAPGAGFLGELVEALEADPERPGAVLAGQPLDVPREFHHQEGLLAGDREHGVVESGHHVGVLDVVEWLLAGDVLGSRLREEVVTQAREVGGRDDALAVVQEDEVRRPDGPGPAARHLDIPQ